MSHAGRWGALRRAGVWLLLGGFAAVSAAETPPPLPRSSMEGSLQELVERLDPMYNPVLNEGRVALFRAQLERTEEAEKRLRVRMLLGSELLLAGDTEAAITELQGTLEVVAGIQNPELAPMRRQLEELLGVAYLRLGEQQNCIVNHTTESCLMPIRGAGVHTLQEGSRRALEQYGKLLAAEPESLAYRWLYNLAAMTLGEYPDKVPEALRIPPAAFASEHPLPRFEDVASAVGVDAVGLAGGSVMEDFDGDGLLDLMASSWGPGDQLRLFLNRGDGTFAEHTAAAGLTGETGGLNLIHADYDNDGHADVLVLRGAWYGFFNQGNQPNSLLRGLGDGRFENVTKAAGLWSEMPTQTAAWGDFDGDGHLDLFVGNESVGKQQHPCELYRNNGDGTFEEVADQVGLDHVGMVKAAVWGDYDGDGRPDLYLSRFGQSNVLFHNEGPVPAATDEAPSGWKFTDVTAAAGVGEPVMSFPAWFWDYDNDGHLDLLAAPFLGFVARSLETVAADYLGLPHKGERPRLYRNRGDGTFEDVTTAAKLDRPMLAMAANYGDLDNDGFLDGYFGTGEPDLATLVPNRMFRNAGGSTFQDVTTAGGFGHLQKGHGIAFGDIDNDGDQDLYAVMGGAYTGDVYQNVLFENPGNDHRWLTLRLEGTRSNRAAIGARVRVVVTGDGEPRSLYRTVGSGGSFGSSSLQLEVGLGTASAVERVEVLWPGGERQLFRGLQPDAVYRLREGEASPKPETPRRFRLAAGAGSHRHHGHTPGGS